MLIKPHSFTSRLHTLIYLAFLLAATYLTGCGTAPSKPQTTEPVTQTSTDENTQSVTSLSELDQSVYLNAKQYLNEGELSRASKQFQTLARKYPNNPQVIINQATCHYLQKEYDEANSTLEKIHKVAQDIPEYHNLRGLLEVEKKAFPEAEKSYLTSIKLNDSFANAHYNLALLYDIYYQDIKKAFLHYTKYLSNIDHEDQATKDWVEQLKYSLDL